MSSGSKPTKRSAMFDAISTFFTIVSSLLLLPTVNKIEIGIIDKVWTDTDAKCISLIAIGFIALLWFALVLVHFFLKDCALSAYAPLIFGIIASITLSFIYQDYYTTLLSNSSLVALCPKIEYLGFLFYNIIPAFISVGIMIKTEQAIEKFKAAFF